MARASFQTILWWLQALKYFRETYEIHGVRQWFEDFVMEYTVLKVKMIQKGDLCFITFNPFYFYFLLS